MLEREEGPPVVANSHWEVVELHMHPIVLADQVSELLHVGLLRHAIHRQLQNQYQCNKQRFTNGRRQAALTTPRFVLLAVRPFVKGRRGEAPMQQK